MTVETAWWLLAVVLVPVLGFACHTGYMVWRGRVSAARKWENRDLTREAIMAAANYTDDLDAEQKRLDAQRKELDAEQAALDARREGRKNLMTTLVASARDTAAAAATDQKT